MRPGSNYRRNSYIRQMKGDNPMDLVMVMYDFGLEARFSARRVALIWFSD